MPHLEQDLTSRKVSIKLPGTVAVRVLAAPAGTPVGQVVIDATGDDDVTATGSEDTLRIRTGQNRPLNVEYDVTIRVTQPIDLRVTAPVADISAEVELGKLDIGCATVHAALQRIGAAKVVVKSGDVHIGEIAGGRAFIASASADVTVERVGTAIDTRTGTGSLRIGDLDGPLVARSATGDLDVDWANDDVEVRTGSGAVRIGVRDELPTWLDLYSGSGAVDVEAPPSQPPADGEPYITVSVATGTGDVLIYQAIESSVAPDNTDETEDESDEGADDDESIRSQ